MYIFFAAYTINSFLQSSADRFAVIKSVFSRFLPTALHREV